MDAFLKVETYGVAALIIPIDKKNVDNAIKFFESSAHAELSSGLSTDNEKVFFIKEGWIFTVGFYKQDKGREGELWIV